MAIVKEYLCRAHGEVESSDGRCPFGCSPKFLTRQIRTVPGLHSAGTARVDVELNNLARDYRMSDIKNDKDGGSVMDEVRKGTATRPMWDSSIPHAKPGFSQMENPDVPKVDPRAHFGVQGDNATTRLKDVLKRPTPDIVKRDTQEYQK